MAEIVGYSEEKKSRITCEGHRLNPGCGAIISYTVKDIQEWSGKDYSGGSSGCKWIVCPGCGKELTLSSW